MEITKFPITPTQRSKNKRGKRSVSCIISERCLRLPKTSDQLQDGHYMFVNVMTGGYNNKNHASFAKSHFPKKSFYRL